MSTRKLVFLGGLLILLVSLPIPLAAAGRISLPFSPPGTSPLLPLRRVVSGSGGGSAPLLPPAGSSPADPVAGNPVLPAPVSQMPSLFSPSAPSAPVSPGGATAGAGRGSVPPLSPSGSSLAGSLGGLVHGNLALTSPGGALPSSQPVQGDLPMSPASGEPSVAVGEPPAPPVPGDTPVPPGEVPTPLAPGCPSTPPAPGDTPVPPGEPPVPPASGDTPVPPGDLPTPPAPLSSGA